MKKVYLCFCLTALVLSLFGCHRTEPFMQEMSTVNATDHGVSPQNSGEQNSIALQSLIDALSAGGGEIYIPAGEYLFAENGRQTIGSHCIKMRSNVSIVGDGAATVLKPVGSSRFGLDMFYFNDYLDTGNAAYLENCRFESFVIDAAATSCETYTSAGKGFMFNLFKNCHWESITVKNTDATGFGVDCPIDSTISDCTAIGCGKAAMEQSSGASGFGIGFGYSENESILISDCKAQDNRKFGFFFEHQGRFDSDKYSAFPTDHFTVKNCSASGNLFGFGGICSTNTVYDQCTSEYSRRYGFYFEDSTDSIAIDCQSNNEREASFAIRQTAAGDAAKTSSVFFLRCAGQNAPISVKVISEQSTAPMLENQVESYDLGDAQYAVYTFGDVQGSALLENLLFTSQKYFPSVKGIPLNIKFQ